MKFPFASPSVQMPYQRRLRVIAECASEMQVLPAALMALLLTEVDVPPGGEINGGFRSDGRPVMLYEPHVFSHLTNHVWDGTAAPQISFPTWNKTHYAADPYTSLETALSLSIEKSLQASSWGIGQILGENFAACGYKTAYQMVSAACYSSGEQLRMMARYLESNGCAGLMRRLDFQGLARKYNGPQYAANKYDVKLKDHFKTAPSLNLPYYNSEPIMNLGDKGAEVTSLQMKINSHLPQIYQIQPDGDLGPGTFRAAMMVLDNHDMMVGTYGKLFKEQIDIISA